MTQPRGDAVLSRGSDVMRTRDASVSGSSPPEPDWLLDGLLVNYRRIRNRWRWGDLSLDLRLNMDPEEEEEDEDGP